LGKLDGKKTPAITRPQIQEIFSRLLRNPAPGPTQIAKEVTQVLLLNEEARIYSWYTKHRQWPPSHRRPDS
jgi:hypothetical protein